MSVRVLAYLQNDPRDVYRSPVYHMKGSCGTARSSHPGFDASPSVFRRVYEPVPAHQCLAQLGEGLGAMRRAIILSDEVGKISWLSELAREWLREFFSDYTENSGSLPPSLKNWINKGRRSGLPQRLSLSGLQTSTTAGFRLLVYYGKNNDGSLVIALARERPVIDPASVAALGLTEREAQILFWISEAKTNPQIAAILGISLRTIHKHTEHIFEKLHIENRMEAQSLAWELRRI